MPDVLVVGGGIAGQATAAFLSASGISCVVVEQADQVAPTSRNHRLGVRAMEALQVIGLADHVTAHGIHPSELGDTIVVDTMAGPDLARYPQPWVDVPDDISQVQPVCVNHAWLTSLLEKQSDVRRGVTVTGLDGTRAELSNGEVIEASYVVGADGTDSLVRQAAGIGRAGPEVAFERPGVVFEAEIKRRDFAMCQVNSIGGMIVAENRPDTWLMIHDGQFEDPVSVALGGIPARILKTFTLPVVLRTASRFRAGHVALVGDAACAMPPAPGFDGGRVIEDAHNLAWKLAAVVRGANPKLLDSYEQERRPVAELGVADNMALTTGGPSPVKDRLLFEVGAVYRSSAVLSNEDSELFVDPRVANGIPGSRPLGTSLASLDFSITEDGCLIRPDGVVAWRSADGAGAVQALDRLLRQGDH